MRNEQRIAVMEVLGGASEMSLATLRPDGWPQATIVTFISDGLDLYFATHPKAQKSANIAADGRVSATVALPHGDAREIRALSMAALAERVTDPGELSQVASLAEKRFPDSWPSRAGFEALAIFRLRPAVISLLDYRKGFGWTELIDCAG